MPDNYNVGGLTYEYLDGKSVTLISLNGKTNVTIPSEVTITTSDGVEETVSVSNIGMTVGNAGMYENKTVTITFERDMTDYSFNTNVTGTSAAFIGNPGANFTFNTNTTKERFESLFGPVENFEGSNTLPNISLMFVLANMNATFNFVFLPSDYSPKSFTYKRDVPPVTYNFSILPSPKPSMKSLMSHMRLHHPLARQTHFQDYSQHIRKRVALNEHKLAMK
jgi:hypothetical protein